MVRCAYSLASMSIMTRMVRPPPVAACRTRSMLPRQTSADASRPSWVSLTEMLQSSSGISWIRFSARMYASVASAA